VNKAKAIPVTGKKANQTSVWGCRAHNTLWRGQSWKSATMT